MDPFFFILIVSWPFMHGWPCCPIVHSYSTSAQTEKLNLHSRASSGRRFIWKGRRKAGVAKEVDRRLVKRMWMKKRIGIEKLLKWLRKAQLYSLNVIIFTQRFLIFNSTERWRRDEEVEDDSQMSSQHSVWLLFLLLVHSYLRARGVLA